MLKITVPSRQLWDEKNEQFIYTKEQTLQLEHSLVSISKWEAKWEKAFLGDKPKSIEETKDYIRCMTLTQNVDPAIYNYLTQENIEAVNAYIKAPMTATKFFKGEETRKNSETITSELIYYWMIALEIPVEFQKWHLNRLLTLIEVCQRKNTPKKKMNQRQIIERNAKLNAERRARLKSKG